MEMRRKKEVTLFWMFLKRVLFMAAAIAAVALLLLLLLNRGMSTGFILPANYAEKYLHEYADTIEDSEPFDESLLPPGCQYGLFDVEGRYRNGSLNKKWKATVSGVLKGTKEKPAELHLFERKDGYCAVKYDVAAHFADAEWNRLIPNAEAGMIFLFLAALLLIVLWNSIRFGKQLKKEMHPLLEEIGQIQKRELGFEWKRSKIKEFNEVTDALEDMGAALTESLKTEWETEQRRKENITAIAHDLKTPLTVMKGNAELIREETDIEEIYAQIEIVIQNADKIQNYIGLLIEEANGRKGNGEKGIEPDALVQDIEQQSRNLCESKHMPVTVCKPETAVLKEGGLVRADAWLLQRAVMNLVMNAVEYTDKEKGIRLSFFYEKPVFRVEVEDFGKGFSKAALRHAKEQLFTERQERGGGHYGMGLYFAENTAKQYGGNIQIRNKEKSPGAKVVFEIELSGEL